MTDICESESHFRPDELLVSKEQCRQQEILPYTWHRFFAILQVLRRANVLDNDINWEETVDAYYGSCRPSHFKFKVMSIREDKTRMDNLEDLLQEAMYMKMLPKNWEDQFNYLLESIPDERLFFTRKGDYDPNLISRCTQPFQLYRRDRVLKTVRETNPKKRRVLVLKNLWSLV